MKRTLFAALAALTMATAPVAAQQAQDSAWEGIVEVKSKKLDKVYLRPGADFRGYTKVMIDPTQVAFRKNWQRDVNREKIDLMNQVTDADARRILDDAQSRFQKLFADAYVKDGYQVVTEAGPDVLRLSTAIANLDVTAPDTNNEPRTRVYSRSAGEATLVLEARDSLTGELLGRALDQRETAEGAPFIRNSVSNAMEFEQLFTRWARTSAEGLTELKSLSPVDASTLQARR